MPLCQCHHPVIQVRRKRSSSREFLAIKTVSVPEDGWTQSDFTTANGVRLLKDLMKVRRSAIRTGSRTLRVGIKGWFDRQFDALFFRVLSRAASIGAKSEGFVTLSPGAHEQLWASAIDEVMRGAGEDLMLEVVPPLTSVGVSVHRKTSLLIGAPWSDSSHHAMTNRVRVIANRVTRITDTTRSRLEGTILEGIREKGTVRDVIDKVRKDLPTIAYNRIPTIVRTEMGNAADAGMKQAYKDSETVTHVSVVGCEAVEKNAPTYKGIPTCNIQNVPVEDVDILTFHPNHTGAIIPSKFRDDDGRVEPVKPTRGRGPEVGEPGVPGDEGPEPVAAPTPVAAPATPPVAVAPKPPAVSESPKVREFLEKQGAIYPKEAYAKTPFADVPELEVSAIRHHTGQFYGITNYFLRNGSFPGFDSDTLQQYADSATSGLRRMSAAGKGYKGTVHRRAELGPQLTADVIRSTYRPGEVVNEMGFTSTSTKPFTGTPNGVLWNIEAKGKGVYVNDISKHTHENEVLFPPNSKFVVTKVVEGANNKFTIHMVEVDDVARARGPVAPQLPSPPTVPVRGHLGKVKPNLMADVSSEAEQRLVDKEVIFISSGQLDQFQKDFGMSPVDFRNQLMDGIDLGEGQVRAKLNYLSDGGWRTEFFHTPVGARGATTEMSRTFDFVNRTVHHDFLQLPEGKQGAGIGKQLLKNQLKVYDHLGIKKVDLYANIDVGGYAWARYGFLPTQTHWDALRRRIKESLPGYSGLTPELRVVVTGIADNPDPRAIRDFASLKEVITFRDEKTSVGKSMLLGKAWDGELDLTDSDSYGVFASYLSK